MASGTETLHPGSVASPGTYTGSGVVACGAYSAGDPSTATCLAPTGSCATKALGGAAADFYNFDAAVQPVAWRTSVTGKVQFTQVANACTNCNVSAVDVFYSTGGGWTRAQQVSACITSSSVTISWALSTSLDISTLRVAVVQWASASDACTGDCSLTNAASFEDVWVEVAWIEPTGACCTGASCSVTTEALCVAGGGTYQGNNTTCSPDPCDLTPTGACCTGAVCTVKTEAACAGTYLGDGTTCSPDPCSGPTGACCLGSTCIETTSALCTFLGGDYKGDGVLCSSSPCPQPPPAGGLLVG